MSITENQQYKDRLAKLEKWRALGVDPYGQRIDGLMPVNDARGLYRGAAETPAEGLDRARVAGRIVLLRDAGKLIFLTIQDSSARIQIGLSKKMIEESGVAHAWEQAKLLELGDIAWFEGKVGHTKTGEVTVWGERVWVGCPRALLPPPDKFHGLTDIGDCGIGSGTWICLRIRNRWMCFCSRSARFSIRIRGVFEGARKFVEVETPMMQAIAGGGGGTAVCDTSQCAGH